MLIKKNYLNFKSAIQRNGKVITGERHWMCIHKAIKEHNWDKPVRQEEQGFIDEKGKYYTRKRALYYAKNIGQIPMNFKKTELISEDLW